MGLSADVHLNEPEIGWEKCFGLLAVTARPTFSFSSSCLHLS